MTLLGMYSEAIQASTKCGSTPPTPTSLSKEVKAEVALSVFFNQHMNRVVSSLLGDEMSTSLFSVPSSVAKSFEKPSMLLYAS